MIDRTAMNYPHRVALGLTSLLALGVTMLSPRDTCGQPANNVSDDATVRASGDISKSRVPGYTRRAIEGWQVFVSEELSENHPEATQKALELLAQQLQEVRRVVPGKAFGRLQDVPIWLSPEYPNSGPKGEYHPGADWLRENGRRPELLRCVEFTNVLIFEREIERMPMMALHELAHAYHDQVLSFEHADVKRLFERAVEQGIYDAVLRSNGNTERAYAMSSPMEYFAETSEAFFGTNDFYPFNHDQLRRHDPEMAKLLGQLWNVSTPAQDEPPSE